MRSALTDRLRAMAQTGHWTLPQLQRHFAYDRLLARLYRRDGGWIVKGAAALPAREIGVRATVDIDICREGDLSVSETDLREAARIDLQDWFTFQVGSPRPTGDAGVARRLPMTAMIGAAI